MKHKILIYDLSDFQGDYDALNKLVGEHLNVHAEGNWKVHTFALHQVGYTILLTLEDGETCESEDEA